MSGESKELGHIIEIWKVSIDVQKHFNDIELRIRNFAITLTVAIMSVAAFALKEKMYFHAFGFEVPVASAMLFFAGFGWIAFYIMDKHWYHRLCFASVGKGNGYV